MAERAHAQRLLVLGVEKARMAAESLRDLLRKPKSGRAMKRSRRRGGRRGQSQQNFRVRLTVRGRDWYTGDLLHQDADVVDSGLLQRQTQVWHRRARAQSFSAFLASFGYKCFREADLAG